MTIAASGGDGEPGNVVHMVGAKIDLDQLHKVLVAQGVPPGVLQQYPVQPPWPTAEGPPPKDDMQAYSLLLRIQHHWAFRLLPRALRTDILNMTGETP